MAALVDTNVLVYRYDERFPAKQRVAVDLLRRGIAEDSVRVPHQAVLEFVSVVTRPLPETGDLILERADALWEAEEMLAEFEVLYPSERVLRTALRGAAVYQLSWFDAHLWAYAEVYGLPEILSEDFEDGRLYGTVRVRDPFGGTVQATTPDRER